MSAWSSAAPFEQTCHAATGSAFDLENRCYEPWGLLFWQPCLLDSFRNLSGIHGSMFRCPWDKFWFPFKIFKIQKHWVFERSLWRHSALNLHWVTLDLEPYCGPNPGILFTTFAHVGNWILSRKLSVRIRSFENLKMPPKLRQLQSNLWNSDFGNLQLATDYWLLCDLELL